MSRLRRSAPFVAAACFVGAWALLHVSPYTHDVITDIPGYASYGDQMQLDSLPYRDFAVEYPPGALPVFVAPTFISGSSATFDYEPGKSPDLITSPDLHAYGEVFGWLMAACGLLALVGVASSRPPGWGLPFVVVSPLLIGSLAATRFDFWPAGLEALALAAFVRARHRLGFGLLGAAVTAKLYPLVLLPLAVVWTFRRRGAGELGRALGVGAAVVALVFLPFLALAPHGLGESLWGQISRPLQIESLAGAALMTFGHPHVYASHGSLSIDDVPGWSTASNLAGIAALVALWLAYALKPADRDRFVRYAAAAVAAFVAFDKVLSPQYLIWLVPLVPLVRGLRGALATVTLLVAFAFTIAYFPGHYFAFAGHQDRAWLVFVRDLVLVALVGVLGLPRLSRPGRGQARSS